MQVFLSKNKNGVFTKTGNTTGQYSSSVLTLGAKQYSSGNLVLDTSVSGAGGMDAAIAANTLYYVYAIVDAGVIKLIATTDNQAPTGYLVHQKVGAFETDGSSNIRDAYKFGDEVDTDWAAYTMAITDSVSASVKSSSPATDQAWWKRDGDSIYINFSYYHQTTVGIAGTGNYTFEIPNNYEVDILKISAGAGNSPNIHGAANGDVGGATLKQFLAVGYQTNGAKLYEKSTNSYVASGTTYAFNNTYVGISGWFKMPILGWNSKIDWTLY